MGSLDGKCAIVTGAGTGLGEAIATLLADRGARVLVADIDAGSGRRVADTIQAAGGQAGYCAFDLCREDTIRMLIETAEFKLGGLDILVNNAANTSLVPYDKSIEHMDLTIWDDTMQANLRGTMLACKYAIPAMRSRGGGAIVNIASGAALRGGPGLSAYGVSKAGIVTLSQYVAAQHGAERIRCNTIAPGVILTPTTEPVFGPAEVQAKVSKMLLSDRLGRPTDIAATVLWLVADDGAYINGQCIQVDGGMLAHQNYIADFTS